MENLDKKKKVITYVSIAIISFLIISVIYFMVRTKINERKFNDDMEQAILSLSENIIYDYHYSGKDGMEGQVIMGWDLKDKILVDNDKEAKDIKEDTLLAIYDGKKRIKVLVPEPMITYHDIKGEDLDKEDLIEKNKAVNAAKIKIEAELMDSDVNKELTERFKAVLRVYLKAMGYTEIEISNK